jgi:hypothetical protein
MCTADVTPITAKTVPWKPADQAGPDFSTLHTCRNFEKIFDYVKANAEVWGFWSRPFWPDT